MADPTNVTRLLHDLAAGRQKALDELMPLVYEELRTIARRYLRGEREGHTLSTTALVHEAYMKLVDIDAVDYRDRGHFYAVASTAMRRILVDHARARRRDKRGGGARPVPLDEVVAMTEQQADELLALDEALGRLEAIDERRARLVTYRFFAGLTFPEAAEALGVSIATAKREWAVARAWLNEELRTG